MAGASMGSETVSPAHSGAGERIRMGQTQTKLTGIPLSHLRHRQHVAEVEIAHTLIECNISFNVLRIEQWKRMIKAVSNVGPCEAWNGVSYRDMREKKLVEEEDRVDRSLAPVHKALKKYGCSILCDGFQVTGHHKHTCLVSHWHLFLACCGCWCWWTHCY